VNHATLIYSKPFELESGKVLSELEISYSTMGKINTNQSNVIWICHALTANSDPTAWWSALVGDGKFYNPEQYFIICANSIGSCYGSSGPLTLKTDGTPYYRDFPQLTIRDIAQAHEILREHLNITTIHTCIGGSLGGQQAMEWAIAKPNIIQSLILMCTNAIHSPWGIAFNETQRLALLADKTFNSNTPDAGANGLVAARAIAMLSYRNYDTYGITQTRNADDSLDNYPASSYQKYQGEKLQKRFNAHSYWLLTKAMDSHNVGRGKNTVEEALQLITAKTLVIGITSDLLFPVSEQRFLAEHINDAKYLEIKSLYGHDGFLIEAESIRVALSDFYQH
jgi:homoserine O-acetyltransferase